MEAFIKKVAVAGVLTALLAGCSKTATHEVQNEYSSPPAQTAHATFNPDFTPNSSAGGPARAYDGSKVAKVSYDGAGNIGAEHAYGELTAEVQPESRDGSYAAAVYVPPGTLAGEHPAQHGKVDLMRWIDAAEWGGLRIKEDHRVHLVKSDGSDVHAGREFALEEGCWNWIAVRQRLKVSDPLSQVWLNGKKMLDSSNPNKTDGNDRPVTKARFGLVEMAPHATEAPDPIDLYLDDVTISDSTLEPPLPMRPPPDSEHVFCRPLPNVMFIVTDDQRADTMLGAGNPIANLVMQEIQNWLRGGGTEFSNAFATTPLCCPSRASMFTGQYAHHHGKKTLNEIPELEDFANDKLKYSLQRYLREWWGYRTALFGKFLNGWQNVYDPNDSPWFSPARPGTPETYFDEYAMFDGQYNSGATKRTCSPTSRSWSCTFVSEAELVQDFYDPNQPSYKLMKSFEPGQATLDFVANRATKFIDDRDTANDAQPWFMYVAPYAPHEQGPSYGKVDPSQPLRRSGAWWQMTVAGEEWNTVVPPSVFSVAPAEDVRSDKPAWVRETGVGTPGDQRTVFERRDPNGDVWPGLREQMVRTLADVNRLVDQIFLKLDQRGETNDTLVFYISDNGYMWREHSPVAARDCYRDIYVPLGGTPQDPYTDGCGLSSKNKPYRESIHVPMYVRWPNKPANWSFLASGHPQPDNRLVANVDMAPTVLDAVGGLRLPASQFDEPMDGRSLANPTGRSALLTEAWVQGGGPVARPAWASLLLGTAGDQYIYSDDNPDTGADEEFDEYYTNLGSDHQNTNHFPDGSYDPGAGDTRPALVDQLTNWRQCTGTNVPPFNTSVNPCP